MRRRRRGRSEGSSVQSPVGIDGHAEPIENGRNDVDQIDGLRSPLRRDPGTVQDEEAVVDLGIAMAAAVAASRAAVIGGDEYL